MAREKKKIIDIKLIIGILFLLVLLIGASYAYFAVEVNSLDYNKTVVTGSTEGVAIASIQNPTEKLNLNVDGSAMSLDNLGTIYADDEENYVKTKSEGFHDIGIITLTNSKKDDSIYRCTANVTISIDNGANSILSFLQEGDLKVFLRWGTHHQVIDLSTLQSTNGKTTIPISLDIVGNNSKSIETYIELTNKETDQSYISGKDINIDIDTTNLQCELTGERAVYLKRTDYGTMNTDFRSEEWKDYIKNIYFVNYVTENLETKIYWDLTNIGTKEHQSPVGSIIGWLEEIPKETDEEEQYYDLYIGSNYRIYTADFIGYFFTNMSNLKNIEFDNFYTDFTTGIWRSFHGSSNVIKMDVSNWDTQKMDFNESFDASYNLEKIDVSNFNTKSATNMTSMFSGLNKIKELDVSNFNTMKVTSMSGMFGGMSSLTELDVSSFYTGNVTRMDGMFMNASSLKELNVSKFDTSKVTAMYNMFNGMSSLQELNVSNFNTREVTSMAQMFYGVSSLQYLDLSNFDTKNLVNTINMFRGMSSLEYLDLRNAEFGQVTNYGGMFDAVKNGLTIIVKDEENQKWINERLKENGKTGNVLIADKS